jgi:catechol 2,3-dioxygenase-like lactoylglutathione lyase family enzyme
MRISGAIVAKRAGLLDFGRPESLAVETRPHSAKIEIKTIAGQKRQRLISSLFTIYDLGDGSMKKYIRVIVISLSLLITAGYSGKGVLMAEERNKGPGFEISFHHIGISVANLEESIAWYKEMLGFEEVTRMSEDAANKMEIGHIRRGNCYVELFQVEGAKPLPEYRRDPSADLRVHGVKHFGLKVDDVFAAVKELKAKGVEIAMGPIDTPGVCFIFIRDNSGNALELIEYK